MPVKKRACGSCRECCFVLKVEAVEKGDNEPCKHLCAAGCGIYESRPQACRAFTCAWREGCMSRFDQPSRTHMVIWSTKLLSPSGMSFESIQCNVRAGRKRHRKTMQWLRGASFTYPVVIVEGKQNELLSKGKSILKWHDDDFINLEFRGNAVVSGKVTPRDEVLKTEKEIEDWRRLTSDSIEVIETDETFRENQLQFIKDVT